MLATRGIGWRTSRILDGRAPSGRAQDHRSYRQLQRDTDHQDAIAETVAREFHVAVEVTLRRGVADRMLAVGDRAPEFELPDQAAVLVTLDELVSRGELILYFYPADFSPVCTAEACAFRNSYDGVAELGIQVVGVSPQSTNSHRRFAERYHLPFPLLSDPRKQVIRSYGVDGPLGFGVRRATFLIDQSKFVRNRVVSDLFAGSHLGLLKQTLLEKTSAP